MFEKILVPIGDSADTRGALTNACELAKILGSKITALFVKDAEKINAALTMPADQQGNDLGAVQNELEREEKISLGFIERWQAKFPDVEIELKTVGGVVHEEILNRSDDYDLIVMGRAVNDEEEDEGYKWVHFREVLHNTTAPVLASTANTQIGTSMLACYDGKKGSLKALVIAASLAQKFDCSLRILTSWYDERKAQQVNKEGVRIAKLLGVKKVIPMSVKLNAEGSITAEIKQQGIDFLFMGAYTKTTVGEMLLGSTTNLIMEQNDCPILFFR